MSLLNFMSEVGVPIFGAVVMAFFIFLSMKYIFDSVIGQIKSTENIIKMLDLKGGYRGRPLAPAPVPSFKIQICV